MQFWKLQDRGDALPYGVAADDDGTPRLFVPGRGLVHWPPVASYLYEGEIGAQRISASAAKRLMATGIGKITPEYADVHKGPAPTIEV